MAARWRLTPHAEDALVEIALWTIRTYGAAQADAYETELIERCEAIAEGRAQVRDCSEFGTVADRLEYARAGRHFVVFTKVGSEVVILDFIHGRADLPRRLAELRTIER